MPTTNKLYNALTYIAASKLRAFLFLLVLVVITYAQTLKYNYTYHDDFGLIRSATLKLSNIDLIFSKGVFYFTQEVKKESDIYYRPLQNLYYAAVKAVGGTKPAPFHFAGILLHFMACWLFYRLLVALDQGKEAALLLAALFAAHPVVTQATAWIPGQAESLLALFVLPGFILLIKFLKAATVKPLYVAGIAVCFALALLTKESAIAFAPLCLLYMALYYKNISKRFTGKVGLVLAAFMAAIITWYYLRTAAVGGYSTLSLQALFSSLLANISLPVAYLGKIFIPLNLSTVPVMEDLSLITGLIVLAGLLAAGFLIKGDRNIKLIVFGLGWYLLFLLPTMYLSVEGATLYAYNHRLYLPLMGLIMALGQLFVVSKLTTVKMYIATALLVVFTIISITCLPAFKNKYSFYQTAIDNSPHSLLAYEGLGKIYIADRKCDEALVVFKNLIAMKPTAHGYYGFVGNTYLNCLGDVSNALVWYQKAMQQDSLSPLVANTCISIGNIYYMDAKEKNIPRAKYWYRRSVGIDSTILYPVETLGNIYLETASYDSAGYWYSRALRIDSASATGYNGIGAVEYMKNDYNKAAAMYLKALSIRPGDKGVIKNLINCYMVIDDYPNAQKYAQEYVAIDTLPTYIKQYLDKKR